MTEMAADLHANFRVGDMAYRGDFTPALAKHIKNFQLTRALLAGVDDMQRNFEPAVRSRRAVAGGSTEVTVKLVMYRAFVEGELDAPGPEGSRPVLQPNDGGVYTAIPQIRSAFHPYGCFTLAFTVNRLRHA